jgi:adenylate cyclase
LRGTYRIRNIDQVVVKGKTEPVGVYEVLDHHTEESFPNLMDVVSYFNEGMRNYRAGKFTNAIAQFDKALACHPKDKLSTTYIERCHHLISHPPDAGWNGVWVMTQK